MEMNRANPTALFISVRTDRWVRGALLRLVCVAVFIVSAFVDTMRAEDDHLGLLLPVLVFIPLTGTYWALLAAWQGTPSDRGGTAHGLSRQLDPISGWAVRQTTGSRGEFKANASGVLEFGGAIALAAGLYILDDPVLAFVCLVAMVVFIGSITINTLIDPAFYMPGRVQIRYEDVVRVSTGLFVGLLVFCVTAWAFPADMRLAVAALSASLLALGPRTRQTDQQMAAAGAAGIVREQAGRAEILDVVHDFDKELNRLGTALAPLRDARPDIYSAYQSLSVGLRELLVQDRLDKIDMDWPGVLREWLDKRKAKSGVDIIFDYSAAPRISPADKRVARIALVNLVSNAIEAEATKVLVRLSQGGVTWTLTVEDDGLPILPVTWARDGGGIARLHHLLDGLVVCHTGDPKAVTARWPVQAGGEGGIPL